jgi:hypothetical protein
MEGGIVHFGCVVKMLECFVNNRHNVTSVHHTRPDLFSHQLANNCSRYGRRVGNCKFAMPAGIVNAEEEFVAFERCDDM